jgi:hypothetical protein
MQNKPTLIGIKKVLTYRTLYHFLIGLVFCCFGLVTFRYKTY